MGDSESRAERLDAYQRSHGTVGFVVGVLYKSFEDRAPYLAALITYYAFVSLFPLLLLFISIMGFVLQSDPSLRQSIENGAIADLPGLGDTLRQNIAGFRGSGLGVGLGLLGVIYGALGAMQASQYAFNTIYAVGRCDQPNPIRSRIRSLGLLVILGSAILVTTGINVAISNAGSLLSQMGTGLTLAGYLADLVINVGLFSLAYRVLTVVDLGWRDVMAGGVISGGMWEVLQTFGSRYVVHEVRHGSAMYGIFGVVLATIAWIYLVSLVIMLSAEVNVVWHRRLWPRSLKAPFTDHMLPTPADLAVYRAYARAPQFKHWESIDVRFDPPADLRQPPVAAIPPAAADSGGHIPRITSDPGGSSAG
ncbi:MAG: YihY/virulence factor BrkB family protein [Acidobacteriota bacterium]|nr:YihY/virulence factor BrkB family protein [Acidobacteriota bacterium]